MEPMRAAGSSNNRMWALVLAAGVAAGVISGAIAEAALIPISAIRVRVYDYATKRWAHRRQHRCPIHG